MAASAVMANDEAMLVVDNLIDEISNSTSIAATVILSQVVYGDV
jgi:hypothetical protein